MAMRPNDIVYGFSQTETAMTGFPQNVCLAGNRQRVHLGLEFELLFRVTDVLDRVRVVFTLGY